MSGEYVNKVQYGSSTLIDITDTTATASDVAQGKYFYLATGEKVVGTSTGGGGTGGITQDANGYLVLDDEACGGVPSGTISITQNGNVDVTEYAQASVNVPTGASNVVTGTFTAGTAGATQTVDVDYSGNGYIKAITVYPADGYYSSSAVYSADHQYAVIGMHAVHAVDGNTAGYGAFYYKSQATGTAMTATRINGSNMFYSQNSPSSSNGCVVIRDNDSFAILVSDTSYGFLSGATYSYVIVYSS